MTFIAAPALAQPKSSGDSNQAVFAAGLSFLHVEGTTGTGFDVNVAKPFMSSGKMNTGIFGDFAWHTDSGEHALGFLVGPRFAHTGSSQFTPFFQVGLGVTRFSASGDACDADSCSASGFTFAPGGGVDVKLNDKLNFRFQLEIPVMHIEGSTHTGVKLMFGISSPIGSK
jgi:hypothetical protein